MNITLRPGLWYSPSVDKIVCLGEPSEHFSHFRLIMGGEVSVVLDDFVESPYIGFFFLHNHYEFIGEVE